MVYDFSNMSDEQLDSALANDWGWFLSPETRVAIARERVRRDDARREAAVTTPNAGDFPDPVESAGTPVSADPVLKPKGWRGMSDDGMRAAGKKNTPESEMLVPRADLPAYASRYRDVLEADTQRYIAEGRSSPRVAEPVEVSDEAPMVTVDGVQVQGQWDAMGPGLGNVQYTLGDVRRAKEAQDAAFQRAGGRRGVPGAPTDDGSPVTPPPEFATPDEAEQYNTRQKDPKTGQLLPSKADEAMAARGFVPVYAPDGRIVYRRGNAAGKPAPGQAGREYWSNVNAVHHEDGDPLWEQPSAAGPTGEFDVLVPSQSSRERTAARQANASMLRLADAAGLPQNADLSEYTPQQLRDMAARRKGAVSADRRAAVVRRAQAAQNPLEYLGRDDVNDWQKMVMAERFLREPQKMTPLGVDAVGASNAMRMMNAEALSGMDPMRQRMAEEALESKYDTLTPEQQVALSIRRGEPMGTGRSAAHVQSRWNYWMNNAGWRPDSLREANFRSEMEDLGYDPVQVDRWIDSRRGAAPPAPRGAGQYYPGQKPPPPPANPMAAPRPFG